MSSYLEDIYRQTGSVYPSIVANSAPSYEITSNSLQYKIEILESTIEQLKTQLYVQESTIHLMQFRFEELLRMLRESSEYNIKFEV